MRPHGDLDSRRAGVLGDIGERLGDDVVRRDLDSFGQSRRDIHVELHRDGRVEERELSFVESIPAAHRASSPLRDLTDQEPDQQNQPFATMNARV
jgi:hypothetical protein